MDTIPFELSFHILRYLVAEGTPCERALALFNLASSSRSWWHVVDSWSSRRAEMDITVLSQLNHGKMKSFPTLNICALTVYCKRIGDICALCNNSRRYRFHYEIFTGLQLCQACQSAYFPKISNARILKYFDIHPGAEEKIRQLETFNMASLKGKQFLNVPLHRWNDVEELVSKGYLSAKRRPRF